jgi:hypothetical protein
MNRLSPRKVVATSDTYLGAADIDTARPLSEEVPATRHARMPTAVASITSATAVTAVRFRITAPSAGQRLAMAIIPMQKKIHTNGWYDMR